jgi:hypothetical protein
VAVVPHMALEYASVVLPVAHLLLVPFHTYDAMAFAAARPP